MECKTQKRTKIKRYSPEELKLVTMQRNKQFYAEHKDKYNKRAKLNYYIKKYSIDLEKLVKYENFEDKLTYCKLMCKLHKIENPKPKKVKPKKIKPKKIKPKLSIEERKRKMCENSKIYYRKNKAIIKLKQQIKLYEKRLNDKQIKKARTYFKNKMELLCETEKDYINPEYVKILQLMQK